MAVVPPAGALPAELRQTIYRLGVPMAPTGPETDSNACPCIGSDAQVDDMSCVRTQNPPVRRRARATYPQGGARDALLAEVIATPPEGAVFA